MKNKIILLFTTIILANSAYGQTNNKSAEKPPLHNEEVDRLNQSKSKWLKNLNEEKAGIDKIISCVNSAKVSEDLQKCRTKKLFLVNDRKQKINF